jgi:hypothetical protein
VPDDAVASLLLPLSLTTMLGPLLACMPCLRPVLLLLLLLLDRLADVLAPNGAGGVG